MKRTASNLPEFPHAKGLLVQEERLEFVKKNKQLVIGIPKEADSTESRIPLTPEAVEMLVEGGHEIIIEKDAGKQANYNDLDYSEKGGRIVTSSQEVYRSDIVLKVAPLIPSEFELVRDNQIIMSSLHLNSSTGDYLRKLIQKKVTAIAFESICDSDGSFPFIRAMSSIAGSTSVLVAAEYLSNVNKGKGVMLGGITGISPTEVVILGAGTAAEFAARAALGLGATVKVFDNSIKRLMELQNLLGQRLYTSIFHPQVLARVLKTADVVIGTLTPEESNLRFVVSEEMVMNMKHGSVIVDLAIDKGGCFETSEIRDHNNPSFEKYGVVHYCVPNITSRVARTASIAMSNVFAPLLLSIGEAGGFQHQLKEDSGLRHGVYVFNGILTNDYLGRLYNLPSRDINLLMAAF
ncbi:MAG: alanine dehydrogenase [Bacteroidales bacterium]|jgi:alanine dehydrogenase|nr:alanine dehydrogenase [Bacteroidales bacterium]HOA10077.1 alanine dehydrogenase [Tenuifilaceae bacterium]MBP8642870.1 alanine dehydrogenase [Bacteroidales bacterium]HOG72499.1 alanine dehydrogenase [Tenuifilaceae bacterium]HPA66587.1 alanine dehydrogenase [Tenuifilaceae bacterium]